MTTQPHTQCKDDFVDHTKSLSFKTKKRQRRFSRTECKNIEMDITETTQIDQSEETKWWVRILCLQLFIVKYGVLFDYFLVGAHTFVNYGCVNTLILLVMMFSGYSFSLDLPSAANRMNCFQRATQFLKQNILSLFYGWCPTQSSKYTYKFTTSKEATSQQDSYCRQQLTKVIVSLVFFTVRFYWFRTPLLLLLPLKLLIIGSTSRMRHSIWRIIVPFYISLHYLGFMFFQIFAYVLLRSITFRECSMVVLETFPCALSTMIFSLYIMSFTECLNRKYELLNNELQTREKFISHISHEFRTVCLSSLGSIELIKDTNLSEEQKELLQNVESASGIILTLIEDILNFSKIDQKLNGISTNSTPTTSNDSNTDNDEIFRLDSCLKTVANVMKGYSKPLNVFVRLVTSKNVENLVVKGNPSCLQQCLINLISNAVKASMPGQTVELHCDTKQHNYDLNETNNNDECSSSRPIRSTAYFLYRFQSWSRNLFYLTYTIERSGAAHEEEIDTYKSHENSPTTTATVHSDASEDSYSSLSTFSADSGYSPSTALHHAPPHAHLLAPTVETLPPSLSRQLDIQKTYIDKYMNACSQSSCHTDSHTTPPQIIVAEDNAINRTVLIKLLKSIGYDALGVCDGKELVQQFNPQQHRLIFTDKSMPNMDGLSAAKEIRSRYGFQSPKIVLVTGDVCCSCRDLPSSHHHHLPCACNDNDHSPVSLHGLIDRVLLKPCTKDDLKRAIHELLPTNQVVESDPITPRK
ncbi:hypothetical protein C9374_013392 [Naegleria lovaniensis]|uniref:Response regulatory domain-containing protein n=1 Tax=Naegleria lovaniensis TaxID=51637 RepID=A0AA88H287_NAELO|nr:uncharacterized protein C9374_013392 [Naegleria lovaniensis]KAG2391907.1 hypothetical protein C9374_013392 [Naegleria lovaniensis]